MQARHGGRAPPASPSPASRGRLPLHLELRQLRYFLAVAELLNFSRAAEKLGIAQLTALREVETALNTYTHDLQRQEHLVAARDQLALFVALGGGGEP